MNLRFARLHPNAKAPLRKHAADAGADVFALEGGVIPPFETRVLHTGITVEVPEGYVLQVWPKSRHDFLAGAGIIDSGYQGEVLIKVVNPSANEVHFAPGDALAQLVLLPCPTPALQEVDAAEIHRQTSARGGSGGIHQSRV